MIEKLRLYDFLSGLIPGVLLVTAISVLFPQTATILDINLPREFVVISYVAVSMVAGLLIQTIGSLFEPTLFKMFGGKPSDLALAGKLGDSYLPAEDATRIKNTLLKYFGADASERSIFLRSISVVESLDSSKAKDFNAQYAYLRSIATLLISILTLLLLSHFFESAIRNYFWLSTVILAVLTLLFSWRAWQRGAYYAREVLLMAEREFSKEKINP